MAKFILDEEDSIITKNIQFKDFIKIHKFLEDSGHKMYITTKNRIKEEWWDYDFLRYKTGDICGAIKPLSGKMIPYQEILDLIDNKEVQSKEPTYEIY